MRESYIALNGKNSNRLLSLACYFINIAFYIFLYHYSMHILYILVYILYEHLHLAYIYVYFQIKILSKSELFYL